MKELKHLTPEMLGKVCDLALARENKYLEDKNSQDPWHTSRIPGWVFSRCSDNCEPFQVPETSELCKYLESIPSPALKELTALMWLGRDNDASFQALLKDVVDDGELAEYVAAKTPLLTYLLDGMSRLNHAKV